MTRSTLPPAGQLVKRSYIDCLRIGLAPIAHKAVFCTWRLETSGDRHDKLRKVPYVRGGYRLAVRYDSSELQPKLMALEEAIADCQRNDCSGVGLVFFPDCGVVGIDFDHCLDGNRKLTATTHQRKALALLMGVAFTERSQSDTGLHAIVLGNAHTAKANGELEVFGDRNFLALTGYGGKGVASQIDDARIERIIALVTEIKQKAVFGGENVKREGPGSSGHPVSKSVVDLMQDSEREGNESIERIESALRFIHPDIDRDTWLKVVFAIRHGLGDRPEAFELADNWSKGMLHAGN